MLIEKQRSTLNSRPDCIRIEMGVCWGTHERASSKAAISNGKVARGLGGGESWYDHIRACPRNRQLCRLLGTLIKTNHKIEWNYSQVALILYCALNFIFREFVFDFTLGFIGKINACYVPKYYINKDITCYYQTQKTVNT